MNRPSSPRLRGSLAVALALGAQVAWLGAQSLDGPGVNSPASDLGSYIATPETASGTQLAPSDTLSVPTFDAVNATPAPGGSGPGSDTPGVFAITTGSSVEFSAAEIPESSTWFSVGFLTLIAGLTAWRRLKQSSRA